MAQRKRLSRRDWVVAGLASMRTNGPDAVAIEPLALTLGATKGSGYWHFTNRADLLAQVMSAWRELATAQVIGRVEATLGSPRDRLGHLLVESAPTAGTAAAELLIMGTHDPVVRAAVEQVTHERIAYVTALIEQAGIPAEIALTRATLVYQAYLGGVCLLVAAPATLAAASHRQLRETLLDLALRPTSSESS